MMLFLLLTLGGPAVVDAQMVFVEIKKNKNNVSDRFMSRTMEETE